MGGEEAGSPPKLKNYFPGAGADARWAENRPFLNVCGSCLQNLSGVRPAVFESAGTPFPIFLYNMNIVPAVFFLYTPIVSSNFPWMSFGYKALIYVFVCMLSWMIGLSPPGEIADQMTHKTAFRLCFNFYTPYTNIETSAQNASKCIITRQKIRRMPLPRPQPTRRLDSRAFGDQCSRFFSFTTPTAKTDLHE